MRKIAHRARLCLRTKTISHQWHIEARSPSPALHNVAFRHNARPLRQQDASHEGHRICSHPTLLPPPPCCLCVHMKCPLRTMSFQPHIHQHLLVPLVTQRRLQPHLNMIARIFPPCRATPPPCSAFISHSWARGGFRRNFWWFNLVLGQSRWSPQFGSVANLFCLFFFGTW